MEQLWPLLVALVTGVGVLIFGKLYVPKRRGVQTPPKNTTADVARETVQQTFEEEVTGVFRAVESKDPGGALADRGNTRRRK